MVREGVRRRGAAVAEVLGLANELVRCIDELDCVDVNERALYQFR